MNVCVQWPRFGPYHLARLRASHAYLGARGIGLIGLETAGTDAAYAWTSSPETEGWVHRCVFPDRDYRTIAPREMEARVFEALDALDPDAVAVHTYSLPDSRACLRWCRARRRPAVMMSDSRYEDAPRSAWWEALKGRIIRQYDAALAAGTDATRYLERLGMPAARIFTGYDVVDNHAFAQAAEAARATPERWRHLPGLDEDAPFFVCVSRYLALKNLDGLLRAYAAYRQRTPSPWRLVIVGDGPERAPLEHLIAEAGIEGVTLTGFMQIDALPAYYALARALVHPAHKDTWGLVINEAMACGLPVVVSRESGCVADLVEEGVNGFTFDAADEATLAALLRGLSHEGASLTAMGDASRRIIEAWDLDRFAHGLHRAVEAGAATARRGLSPDVVVLFWILRTLARAPEAFHRVPA